MPGSHIICANKDVTARGPLWVWSAIGIAILKDRSKGSSLFIEDANTYGNDSTTESEMIGYLEGTLRKVIVLPCADKIREWNTNVSM